MATLIRRAEEPDLAQAHRVWYENEFHGVTSPSTAAGIPSDLRHILRTGTMVVAEQDGEVMAFAAAIRRGTVAFLTDLFVLPDRQSAGLGRALLETVLSPDQRSQCTLSSTDSRALGLYIRHGLRPRWPHFNLRWGRSPTSSSAEADVEVIQTEAEDPGVARWDEWIGGRSRPADHAYWAREQRAAPLWFRRHGTVVGYGYARFGAGTLQDPTACRLGPIGGATPEDAAACVLAAVNWVQERADIVLIDVPGPHLGLAPLLAARFQITYVENFLSTEGGPIFDASCYIPSGSNLL